MITDIYHLAISSLRSGKPTLGLGASSPSPRSTLSDKKKKILFRQHLLGHLYMPTEQIQRVADRDHELNSLAAECAKALANPRALRLSLDLLDQHVARCKRHLHNALCS